MYIIERIMNLLNKNNSNEKDLADYLDVHVNIVYGWKNKVDDIPAKYIQQISKFLNVPIEYIITGNYIRLLANSESELLSLYSYLDPLEKRVIIGNISEMIIKKNIKNRLFTYSIYSIIFQRIKTHYFYYCVF